MQLKSGTSEAKTTIELEQAGMAPRSQPALLIRQLHSRYRAWCCPHDVATASKTAGHGPKLGVQSTSDQIEIVAGAGVSALACSLVQLRRLRIVFGNPASSLVVSASESNCTMALFSMGGLR